MVKIENRKLKWKLVNGKWKMEMEIGRWKLEGGNRRKSTWFTLFSTSKLTGLVNRIDTSD